MSIGSRLPGSSFGTLKTYRSKNGQHLFRFRFVPLGNRIAIYSISRPPLCGRDPDPEKTHLFRSGEICFIEGQEPRTQARAEELARQWAEFYLSYRRTGEVQK